MIQLFDLSVIPQSHPPETDSGCSSSLPSFIHRGRSDSLLSLGTLLYRIAHRLSLSLVTLLICFSDLCIALLSFARM